MITYTFTAGDNRQYPPNVTLSKESRIMAFGKNVFTTTSRTYGTSSDDTWVLEKKVLEQTQMSRGDKEDVLMAFNKKKSKKKPDKDKKGIEFKSEIVPMVISNLGIDMDSITLLLHSPTYTPRNSDILRDFNAMPHIGYQVHCISDIESPVNTLLGAWPPGIFSRIFVSGMLEHLTGIMAQALFLKNLMYIISSERSGYLILHTKTRKQIREEAERNNYPKDGKGYLISLPDGKQSRIEGIDNDEVQTLIAYGRIGSIWKTDNLSKVKGSHIILWNGV